ncbi:unnamed protein product [Schistocephalus solidus]|uniref:Adaptin_N domain-containing protein n=1 Tax=Schistocephalus solidus TaxID=70667 RepID=A0A183SY02_SCHSO|nr:unnamed protein product [Schistocephalus solidus]
MLRFAPAVTTKTSLQDCVSNVTIGHISASSERLQVLKLAYHILRLAPRNFPTALVQALVSSCLTPLQGATASSVVDRVMGAGNVLAAVNVNNRSGVPTHPPPAEAPALLPVSRTASKYEAVADDPHIHACLLILVEFGKFRPTDGLISAASACDWSNIVPFTLFSLCYVLKNESSFSRIVTEFHDTMAVGSRGRKQCFHIRVLPAMFPWMY